MFVLCEADNKNNNLDDSDNNINSNINNDSGMSGMIQKHHSNTASSKSNITQTHNHKHNHKHNHTSTSTMTTGNNSKAPAQQTAVGMRYTEFVTKQRTALARFERTKQRIVR